MIDQHPDEWYELRRTGIGGSDAAAVLGMSKCKTPYQVWREKVYGERQPDNGQFERGRDLESFIRGKYVWETGKSVVMPSFLRLPEFPYICGNLDGVIHGDRKVVEFKTSLFDDWGDEPPIEYVLQCQHYLFITGYDETDLVVLILSTWKIKTFHIHSDAELQKLMVENYQKFWKHVEDKTPPEPVNCEDLKKMFPSSLSNSKTLSATAIDACKSIKEMKKQVADLQGAIEELEFQIKNELQDSDTGVDADGKTICTWKTSKPRQTIDSARLKAEEPGIYNSFLKQGTSSRTFLIK